MKLKRLADMSPYLQEHIENPVEWYIWDKSTFSKARKEKKLVFVSIGYSACHWCHVMRRESFENEQIAKLMNNYFVNIKIDREERPDIDHQLQMVHQMLTGRAGGWPLSIWLTPEKKPVYAGTYFPNIPKHGIPSFVKVINAVQDAFLNRNELLLQQAESLTKHIRKISQSESTSIVEEVNEIQSKVLIESILDNFDSKNGGFGIRPKFPNETVLSFLLHESVRLNNYEGINAVTHSLTTMINGGIYDQIGGGIARYSVDEQWLVPHFEKMLYNQAMLIDVLVDAYRVTKKTLFKEKIMEIVNYLEREMLDKKSNGFFSSQNADSEGIEGKYYVFSYEEIKNILPETEFESLKQYYDLTPNGNWEGEGKIILRIKEDLESIKEKLGFDPTSNIQSAKNKLFLERKKRIKPSTDTKILTSWNSLLLRALAKSLPLFSGDIYNKIFMLTKNGLDFLIKEMLTQQVLYRTWINGTAKGEGFLDDYQYLIAALLEFFQISIDTRYLKKAKQLFDQTLDFFMDESTSQIFFSSLRHDTVISRFDDVFDNPLPSPIALTIQNALKLEYFFENNTTRYEKIAKRILLRYQKQLAKAHPSSTATFLLASLTYLHNYTQLTFVLSNNENMSNLSDFLLQINNIFIPFRFQITLSPQELVHIPWINDKYSNILDFLIVCKNQKCSLPMTSIENFNEYLVSNV